jgi:hypothetical protein
MTAPRTQSCDGAENPIMSEAWKRSVGYWIDVDGGSTPHRERALWKPAAPARLSTVVRRWNGVRLAPSATEVIDCTPARFRAWVVCASPQ